MTQQELAGDWAMTDPSGTYRCALPIPGDGISALFAAGLIPDPYWGRNEYDLRWIAERDWVASRTFDLTDTDVELVISGLDCVAEVTVNGQIVLAAQNCFVTYRVPIGAAAQVGRNEIAITFRSSIRRAAELQAAQPFPIPFQETNNPIANVNMLRKPQCDYGWDWNIALAPFGILGDVRLVPAGTPRIDRLAIVQDHADGVCVGVEAHVSHTAADVTFAFDGQTVVAPVQDGKAVAAFVVGSPRLWWPAGQGDQPLYDLTVTVAGATAKRRIGLRTAALVTEADSAGLGFKFRLNGRDVFAKGANWIPADALGGQITPEKTRDLLQSAVDANMNMIRVWGGGRYEDDWFYDLCDELGLMVWQDFMFACNLYPSTDDFLAEVRTEVAQNVARLHHHACIVLWCGDNELIGALTWFEESRADRDRYLVNYDRLNRTIEAGLRAADPTANWWPSSPSPGPLSFGDAWHDDGSGDMHFWSVWHEGRDFAHYRDVSPRFCSEFGFQSYPSMEAIARFADPADWNIASPVLEAHQKNAGGNARIAETMFRYFRWPERFDDFVYLSQVQQALAIRTAVTHWRALRPHCMGTLIWQLNDTWPVCSWASLNHGGDWKLLHHAARAFYADLIVTAVPDGADIVLRGVYDQPTSAMVAVAARAVTPAGETRALGQVTADVGTDAADLMRLPAAALSADEMLVIDWESDAGSGREVFAPKPYKAYALQDPGLELLQDHARLTVMARGLSLFAALEADVPGRFSDNLFDLMPGESRTVTFTPADPAARPKFTLRDLYSATTAQRT